MVQDQPLLIPITLASSSSATSTYNEPVVLSASTSWGFGDLPPSSDPSSSVHRERSSSRGRKRRSKGVAVGCSDGTIWIYPLASSSSSPSHSADGHPSHHGASSPKPPTSSALSVPQHVSSRRDLRSPSPPHSSASSIRSLSSSHAAPAPSSTFLHRSRIPSISGVTSAQASAPVLTSVTDTVKERKEDLRELLAAGGAVGGRKAGGSLQGRSTLGLGLSTTNAEALDEMLDDVRPHLPEPELTESGMRLGGKAKSSTSIASTRTTPSTPKRTSAAPLDRSSTQPSSPSSLPFVRLPTSPTTRPASLAFSLQPPSSPIDHIELPRPATEKPYTSLSSSLPIHVYPSHLGQKHAISQLESMGDDQDRVVCLQRSGHLSINSTLDGLCLSSLYLPAKSPSSSSPSPLVWRSFALLQIHGIPHAVVLASTDLAEWEEEEEKGQEKQGKGRSVLVIVDLDEMKIVGERKSSDGSYSQLAVLSSGFASHTLLLACPTHLSSISLLHPTPSQPSSSSPVPHASALTATNNDSSNPLTSFFQPKGRFAPTNPHPASSDREKKAVRFEDARMIEGLKLDVGEPMGLERWEAEGSEVWVVAGEKGVVLVELAAEGKSTHQVSTTLMRSGVRDARVVGKTLMLAISGQVSSHKLLRTDPDNDTTASPSVARLEEVATIATDSSLFSTPSTLILPASPSTLLVLTASDSTTPPSIQSQTLSSNSLSVSDLFIPPVSDLSTPSTNVTALLPSSPYSFGEVFVTDDLGRLLRRTLLHSSSPSASPLTEHDSTPAQSLEGRISSLIHVPSSQAGETTGHVVGGTNQGSVAVWSASSLRLEATFTLFTSPVRSITLLSQPEAGRFRGCLLCIAEDGTIGLVLLDGLKFLYLIPGARAPLSRLHIGHESILLCYENGKARMWDLKSQELRRSMGVEVGLEGVEGKEGWIELLIESGIDSSSVSAVRGVPSSLTSQNEDLARTLLIDLSSLPSLLPARKTPTSDPPSTSSIKTLLSVLLSWGIDAEHDRLCEEELGLDSVVGSKLRVGVCGSSGSMASFSSSNLASEWKISPSATASRLLAIMSCLQLLAPEYELVIAELTTFYTRQLDELVGSDFTAPLLASFAEYWLHRTAPVQQAARILFRSRLAFSSDEDLVRLVGRWQHELPSRRPATEQNSPSAGQALILIGQIAVENQSLFKPELLKDIANSISLYLHSHTSPYRALAIDLTSTGFQIWQHSIDPLPLLRSLFHLCTLKSAPTATTPQHPPSSLTSTSLANSFTPPPNLPALARTAILSIASSNTPLFTTTLSFDILNATSPTQRNATMKLVAWMAKKRPLVLYGSLARIVEAVVKSLDPNVQTVREAVLETTTVILESLVSTFPSIDFHPKSQKLAVGTHEGAVILYDLKTATRLYVLEAHVHKITALSFSPDGRRLVTVSLDESLINIWKVGTSFSSMFNVGVPPRQGGSLFLVPFQALAAASTEKEADTAGHPSSVAGPTEGKETGPSTVAAAGGAETGKDHAKPFKRVEFNVGDEGKMTTAASLEWVKFEWPGERSARLRIRETALTFAT